MSTTKKLGWGSTLATIVENNAGGVGRRYRRSTEGLQPETEEAVDTSLARTLVELGVCSGQAREVIEASRAEAELPAQGDAYFHETIGPALAEHPEAERHVPMLLVTQREDRHVLGEALQCVSGTNARQLRLFTRDILVRLVHADDGSPRTEPLTTPAMRAFLAQSANIRKMTAATKKAPPSLIEAPVPPNLASELLALPSDVLQQVAPPLAGITQLPIVRADGNIRTAAGYDPASCFMLDAPSGLAIPPVPDVPTDEQVREALLAFDDLLVDFPFVDQASRANALGMMLTPIVRPAIRGCVPPFVIDAPRMGTGKGLLCDVVSVAVTGRSLEAMTLPEKEEEVEKRITSILLGAPAVARIDNVGRPLDSDHLCSLWTSQTWEGRYLGHSKMLKLPNETTWLITLNNARLEGDVPRRVVYVRLDARVERPWERSAFRHPDLLAHATAMRGCTIWAALVLVRRWAALACAGPGDEVPTKGSYEEWRRIVGGILRAAGVHGFLANTAQVFETVATEDRDWLGFFTAWAAQFGSRLLTTKQVAEELTAEAVGGRHGFRESAPDEIVDLAERRSMATLGKRLGKHKDTPLGGLVLRQVPDPVDHVSRWRVERADGGLIDEPPKVTAAF
jgi:hypothetical protein